MKRDYGLWWLAGLVILALGVAACGAATPTPTPTPAGGPPPEETPTPEVPPAESGAPYEANTEALADLDSYTYEFSWSWQGGGAGGFQSSAFAGQGRIQNRPSPAQHIVWTSTDAAGTASTTEWVYIEEVGTLWMRTDQGEWTAVPGLDPAGFEGLTLVGFFSAYAFSSPEDLSFVGVETVNGVQARHYRSQTFAYLLGLGCTVSEASDEVWVAVEGSFPVKQESGFSGSCGGQSAEWSYILNVANINQSLNIEPPV